jgi:hypothetical protein
MELTACPECGLPAEVVAENGAGACDLVRVRCVDRHWFLGLRDRLIAPVLPIWERQVQWRD